MPEELGTIADEIAALDARVSDLVYDALRSQVRGDDDDGARELERQLARVRRALGRAEQVLRSLGPSGNVSP